ncbi:MAG: hypothetical protein LBU39_09805, partial [Desulfobulbaceae bacterium]|nr:hypothetical protein [Desulfobulbaceae bacterium]
MAQPTRSAFSRQEKYYEIKKYDIQGEKRVAVKKILTTPSRTNNITRNQLKYYSPPTHQRATGLHKLLPCRGSAGFYEFFMPLTSICHIVDDSGLVALVSRVSSETPYCRQCSGCRVWPGCDGAEYATKIPRQNAKNKI